MKKYMSGIVCLCLILSIFFAAAPARAATYKDVPSSHWAYQYIEYLSTKDVLAGDGNGKFRPNDSVSRAEFIKMMAAAFGLKDTKQISYKNVPDWAVKYISAAAAQGFLFDYKENTNFSEKLSRQEAVSLLMRYLGFSYEGKIKESDIKDISSVNKVYKDYILAAVEHKIVAGYEDGSFKPTRILSRAEALTLLYQATGSIYNLSADKNDPNGSSSNATINASVTLSGLKLSGNVYITEGSKFLTLTDCTIDGTLYVRAGTYLNITMCKIEKIVVLKGDATIALNSASEIERIEPEGKTAVTMGSGCKVTTILCRKGAEGSTVSGSGDLKNYGAYCPDTACSIEPEFYFVDEGCTALIGGIMFGPGNGPFVGLGIYDIKTAVNGTYAVIEGKAGLDGTVYAAAWMDNLQPLKAEEIIGQAEGVKAAKGGPVSIRLELDCDPQYYVFGFVFVPDDSSIAKKGPIYGKADSSGAIGFMTKAPEPKEVKAPKAEIYFESGIIELDFDQILYIKNNSGELVQPDIPSVLSSVTKETIGGVPALIGYNNYTAEIYSTGGHTKIVIYLDNGIEANTRYGILLAQGLVSAYGMTPESLEFTTAYSKTASVVEPMISPDKKLLDKDQEVEISVPSAVSSIYYVYTINGQNPQSETIAQGDVMISFSNLPANTLINIEASAVSANGEKVGQIISSEFIVNASVTVNINGVNYTGSSGKIKLSGPGPLPVYTALPSGLSSAGYELHLYIDDTETALSTIITKPCILRAVLTHKGEEIAQTKVTVE